jgi:hypothetical protein
LNKQYVYVMDTQPVIRVTMFLNLLTAILKKIQESKNPKYTKADFDKIATYCFAWSIGGLFETEERERLHKLLEQINPANLPQIQGQKGVDKETIFDYYFNTEFMDWRIWTAKPYEEKRKVGFSQLLIPTIDST